jgi:hypothetical protein
LTSLTSSRVKFEWNSSHQQAIEKIKKFIGTEVLLCYRDFNKAVRDDFGWDLKIFWDSEWAGDPYTRVSVTGLIIYLLNLPIYWRSKSQKGVTLLSTEAEYVSISEAGKELKFIYYLLSDLHIKMNLPIVVKTDNIGTIFMSKNASTGFCTRHVDTRYHFVQ